jgi:hypothetical protein
MYLYRTTDRQTDREREREREMHIPMPQLGLEEMTPVFER